MFIRVETSSGVPITRQIADQIRTLSASGALAPGDRLPSVRQLAKELTVNQNTILRVYERLTAEGLLERRQGDGTFMCESLPKGRAKAQKELLAAEVDRVVHRALDLGVDSDALKKMVEDSLSRARRERSS